MIGIRTYLQAIIHRTISGKMAAKSSAIDRVSLHRQKAAVGSEAGFTLIELMLVIAIIGNLAAVAMPMFEQQVSRAQMSEGLGFLMDAKSALAEYYAVEGRFPTALTDAYGPAWTGNDLGKYTDRIIGWGSLDPSYPDIYYLSADFKDSNVAEGLMLSGFIGLKTTDGGLNWTCGFFWYGYERYYPTNCQNYI
ncbi:MAG: pilin [Magnetococcales bacterium]|nr:pilin [Magnetococcales bacterium]